jgi:hypothetical protein
MSWRIPVMKKLKFTLVLSLVLAIFAGEILAGARKVGEVAPTFKLMSLDGKGETDLSSFRGERPVVLFFGSYT